MKNSAVPRDYRTKRTHPRRNEPFRDGFKQLVSISFRRLCFIIVEQRRRPTVLGDQTIFSWFCCSGLSFFAWLLWLMELPSKKLNMVESNMKVKWSSSLIVEIRVLAKVDGLTENCCSRWSGNFNALVFFHLRKFPTLFSDLSLLQFLLTQRFTQNTTLLIKEWEVVSNC